MSFNYAFTLTPAYCLYNGAAVLEQNGAYIKFLVEDKNNALLCGRLTRAFNNYVANVRHFKDCPDAFQRLIQIDFVNGSRAQLKKCVLKLYRANEQDVQNERNKQDERNEIESPELEVVSDNQEAAGRREAAAILLLDSILNEARLRNATDIHIENCCVRLRINGRLEEMLCLQNEKALELIQRIKLLAGMNVIENRKCQDGNFIYGNKNPFFLRVSTMAAIGKSFTGDESVVVRLLDTSRIPLALGELGFNSIQLERIAGEGGLCSAANGLVLVCGPTGSGKTTSVAAMLVEIEKLAQQSLKIISLEDPPEYIIPGITQVKVDERNSFSDALNHIFRQDPDVIMIGEIRDEESAAAALRASLTGHLVFATLHCSCASESILRLENLGVERQLLCQVLRGIICQELNPMGGRMRLYADVAIPGEKFRKRAGMLQSSEQLEELMSHFTNYSELFNETIEELKKKQSSKEKTASRGCKKSKPVIPLYKRGHENDGIHQNAV